MRVAWSSATTSSSPVGYTLRTASSCSADCAVSVCAFTRSSRWQKPGRRAARGAARTRSRRWRRATSSHTADGDAAGKQLVRDGAWREHDVEQHREPGADDRGDQRDDDGLRHHAAEERARRARRSPSACHTTRRAPR